MTFIVWCLQGHFLAHEYLLVGCCFPAVWMDKTEWAEMLQWMVHTQTLHTHPNTHTHTRCSLKWLWGLCSWVCEHRLNRAVTRTQGATCFLMGTKSATKTGYNFSQMFSHTSNSFFSLSDFQKKNKTKPTERYGNRYHLSPKNSAVGTTSKLCQMQGRRWTGCVSECNRVFTTGSGDFNL